MEIIQSEQIIKEKYIPILDLDFVKTKREDDPQQHQRSKKDEKKYQGKTKKVLTTIATPMQPGHSGFLTFATLPPVTMR